MKKLFIELCKNNIVTIIIISFILIVFGITSICFKDELAISNIGQFLSGTAGIFISLLGFIALIYTLIFQQKQITDNQANSNKQAFETNYFHLLDLYNNIVSDLELRTDDEYFKPFEPLFKRNIFKKLYEKFIEEYSDERLKQSDFDYINKFNYDNATEDELEYIFKLIHVRDLTPQYIILSYLDFSKNYESLIAHYFRTIYQILKYLDNNEYVINRHWNTEVTFEVKFYSNILRAQLSTYELVMLYLNCLSENGFDKFLPLMIKFDMFEHINKDLLFDDKFSKFSSLSYEEIKRELYNSEYDKLKKNYHYYLPPPIHRDKDLRT